jgi:hypothetical protein
VGRSHAGNRNAGNAGTFANDRVQFILQPVRWRVGGVQVAQLLDEFSLVSFMPLDINDEDTCAPPRFSPTGPPALPASACLSCVPVLPVLTHLPGGPACVTTACRMMSLPACFGTAYHRMCCLLLDLYSPLRCMLAGLHCWSWPARIAVQSICPFCTHTRTAQMHLPACTVGAARRQCGRDASPLPQLKRPHCTMLSAAPQPALPPRANNATN